MIMKNLVNWAPATADYFASGAFSGYADSGEGGLFAWAVVRSTSDNEPATRAEGGCNVDVHVVLSQPDVQVSGPDLWTNHDDYSFGESVTAAVFLGATSHSLYSSESGNYFTVTPDSLTDEGKAIVAALSVVGKVELLTFLDT